MAPGQEIDRRVCYYTRPIVPDETVRFLTPRLVLRSLTASDLPAYHYGLRASPTVMKYSMTHLPDADEAASWLKLGPYCRPLDINSDVKGDELCLLLGIELRNHDDDELGSTGGSPRLIGDVGVHGVEFVSGSDGEEARWEAEIGYMLAEKVWGQGIASEALAAFIQCWWSLETQIITEPALQPVKGIADHERQEPRRETVENNRTQSDVLVAIIEEEHIASYKVLCKCGFEEQKRFVEPDNGDRLVKMVLRRPIK